MTTQGYQILSGKIADGKASKAEVALYNAAWESFQADQPEWEVMGLDRNQLQQESLAKFWKDTNNIRQRELKLWPRIVAVSAAVVLMVVGVYFFNYRNREMGKQAQDDLVVNDVAPGKVGATLTLANGKKIRLSDTTNGELAKEAGVVISKTADGQLVYEITPLSSRAAAKDSSKLEMINTLSTAKGEAYMVILPDKSKVWLNAASSLRYPASFGKSNSRRVELTGEGYFEIAKDKAHPFIVETKDQQVEVLGTHFNINSYEDEPVVATTLLEGSVKVSSGNIVKMLKPGQQAVLTDNKLKVSVANIQSTMAWKNGQFVFDDESLESIMRKIARWYDVEVEYKGSIPSKSFIGKISRCKNIAEVLEILKLTESINFKIEGTVDNNARGRRIIIMP